MPTRKKPWHMGSFQRDGAKLKAAAYADPFHRCWRCGLTLAEARARWGAKVHWQAGHVKAKQVGGPLLAECSHCNIVAGNLARQGKTKLRTSLTW